MSKKSRKSTSYSSEEIAYRRSILNSHKSLTQFLSKYIINHLFKLFDKTNQYNVPSITDYVAIVRKEMGLDDTNVEITSKLYTINPKSRNDSRQGLHLQIKKNGRDFLHLSLFITPVRTGNTTQGMIHFSKNVYVPLNKKITIDKSLLYAIIKVEERKPHSLHFSLGTGQNTSGLPNIPLHEIEIKQEMEAILITLNRLFDEHHAWYIGNTKRNMEVHLQVNNTLHIMQKKELPYEHNKTKTTTFMNIEPNFPFHSLPSKSSWRIHSTLKKQKSKPNIDNI
jgi:hypothetical protein